MYLLHWMWSGVGICISFFTTAKSKALEALEHLIHLYFLEAWGRELNDLKQARGMMIL